MSAIFYSTSPEIIFDAWLNPGITRKLPFVGPSSKITHIEVDAQAGGKFSIPELERSNGWYIDHYNEYQEADHPHRLAFTLSVPKLFTEETQVTIEIEPQTRDSEFILTQTGASPDKTEATWSEMLQQLSVVLNKMYK